MELSEKKLKTRDYVVIASLLFGLFFGAGNLIFPLHLGQLAGANWFPAMLGFLVTAVALPLLGVLAIAATHAEGVYDIGRPLGRFFALAFMVLIHATIGPMFGTPRTATVSFTTGVLPMLAKSVGAGWSAGLLGFILCRRLFPILQGTQNHNGCWQNSQSSFPCLAILRLLYWFLPSNGKSSNPNCHSSL